MKNISLIFSLVFICTYGLISGQAIIYTEAPPTDLSTSKTRAPNGTSAHVYMRASQLVQASHLTDIAPGSTITSFGFTLSAGADATAPVGNFTVYLQNTTDVSYNKGNAWSAVLTGMTNVYASTLSIPFSTGATSVVVTLSTPFVYTRNGIYVAYDWYCPGPYSNVAAVYNCISGSSLAITSTAVAPPPSAISLTSGRVCFLWGAITPVTVNLI